MQTSDPAQRMAKLITYATLTGLWPSIDELRSILRPFRRADVLLRLAWLNALTLQWQPLKDTQQDSRVREYIMPERVPAISAWVQRNGEGFVFLRYSILWLMREALSVCRADGKLIQTRDDLQQLGVACLIANDLACLRSPKRFEAPLAVIANFIPQYEYFSHGEYERDLARALYMLTEIASRADEESVKTVPERIEQLIGHSVGEYFDLVMASAMKPVSATADEVQSFRIPTLAAANFSTTTIPVELAATFLEAISSDEDGFVASFAQFRNTNDLTPFRERPFLRCGGEHVPLDTGLILDKAGRGLFWTALKCLPGNRNREQLLCDWGRLFERYIEAIFETELTNRACFLPRPTFQDGAEAFDGCMLEGRTLTVMEYKANSLPNAVKLADDPEKLGGLLERRFISGEGHGRKGLTQLSHSILRFCAGDDLIHATRGVRVNVRDVTKIIPVLIHIETSLRAPLVNAYMAGRLKDMGRPRRIVLTPLVVASVTEIEELQGLLREYRFCDLLESFLGTFRTDRAAMFFANNIPMLKGCNRTPGAILQKFNAYLDAIRSRLFPDAPQTSV